MIFLFVLNLSYTRPLWGNSLGHEKGIGMMKHEARELVALAYVEIAKARIENAKKKYPLGV